MLLTFESVLSGSILLECSFSGSIRGPLNGLYHCDFNGIAGASTHFEPVYARYAALLFASARFYWFHHKVAREIREECFGEVDVRPSKLVPSQ